jgi:inorganic pyrophosphatase
MGGSGFWEYLDSLVESSRLVIDRPKGSTHPRYPKLVYPLNYGYLEGTKGGDGQGVDVWVGSCPGVVDAVLVTVDLEKRDVEVKILLGCTSEEKRIAAACSNSHSMSCVLVPRE